MNADSLRGLVQPDQRSCGPSSLVAARMLLDPSYAPGSFAEEVLALHRQVTAASSFGRSQMPWPRALGTAPWAIARAMGEMTGRRYRTRVVRFGDRVGDYDAVVAAVTEDLPCPLYVGDTWLPRHVVLAVAPASSGGVEIYNPAGGNLGGSSRAEFESGRLATMGRWTRPWLALVPASG